MKEIHQLLAGASVGDAITNYAMDIRGIFRSLGIVSQIYVPYQHISPDLRGDILPLPESPAHHSKDGALLYHFSIGSEATEYFIGAPGKKILCYHNITPEKYYRSINDQRARVLFEGREELKRLSGVPDISLAVSRFNARELEQMGYKNPGVIPLTMSDDYLKAKPSKKIIRAYGDGLVNFLFVGRVSPNKKLEDVLKVFYYYNKTIEPASRLIFAGSFTGNEKYYTYLRSLASEMLLQNIVFTGHVSLEDLLGYYSCSSLFLCMSEHEGVCIPLIESMYFRKPVFALARAAIPETLNGTGVLLLDKDHRKIAELIHSVLGNKALLNDIIEKQGQRVKDFLKSRLTEGLKEALGI
jgi:L-malate glycosyltransferase